MFWSLFSNDTSDSSDLSRIDQLYRSWKANEANREFFYNKKIVPTDEQMLKELSVEGIVQYTEVAWEESEESLDTFQVFFFQFLSHASEHIKEFSSEEIEDVLAVVEKLEIIPMLDYCFHHAKITPKFFLNSVILSHEQNTLSHQSKEILKKWSTVLDSRSLPCGVDISRILARIVPDGNAFTQKDAFGSQANNLLSLLSPIEQQHWAELIWYARQNKLSGTSAKNKKDIGSLIRTLWENRFLRMVAVWVDHIEKMEITEVTLEHYITYELIVPDNREILKGLCIGLGVLQMKESLALLSRLALVFYKKIPNKWPASIELWNICVAILADQFGLQSISHLFRIRHKTRHPSTQKYIDKQILTISRKIGYSPEQLEDMSIPDYEIRDRSIAFDLPDDSSGLLTIKPDFSLSLTWKDWNGKVYKSPTTQMSEHLEMIRDIKLEKKELQLVLSYLKKKLEDMLMTGRKIEWSHFEKYFLKHPVVSLYVQWLIWNIYDSQGQRIDTVSCLNGSLSRLSWETVDVKNEMLVQLFHPCETDAATNLSWQIEIAKSGITPPFKQVDRECYEVWNNTSNVTWVVLAQHQAVALAKERWWIAQLIGDFDSWFDGFSRIITSENITVILELEWIGSIDPNSSWIYPEIILRDLKWVKTDSRERVLESTLPPRLHSEILRDVDLFLSVAVQR